MRGTGGNRFIDRDASIEDLVAAIRRGLRELRDWAADDDERSLDLSAITVDTKPTRDGRLISVSVTADLVREVRAASVARAAGDGEGS